MKENLLNQCFFILLLATVLFHSNKAVSQVAEWRLVLNSYNTTDPDAAGPAKGSFEFSLEMRAASGSISTKEITVGYSYDSTKAMVPATASCTSTSSSTPGNITVSQAFVNAGYSTYNSVNQCNRLTTSAGGKVFTKTAGGSLDQGSITLSTTWVPAFKVTLWALSSSFPEGGYLMVHSGSTGSPGNFGNYDMIDVNDNVVTVNSQTFNTPIIASPTALPITLSRFDAACTGNGALLSWETLTENNNDRFEVEKSANGTGAWNSIGSIKGAGNSTSLKQYTFTDAQTTANAFYRLRQVDADGKYTYSSIEKTDCNTGSARMVVYPIPAENIMNVVLNAERNSKATIKLLDISGRLFKMQKVDLLKGSNKITLNVSQVISGNYILRIERDNQVQIREVIIK